MHRKFKDLKQLSSQVKEPFIKEEQNIFKYWRKNEVKYIRIKYIKNIPVAFACLVDIEKVYKIKTYMLIIGCLPKFRRKGITTKLIKSILKEASKDNIPIVFHILENNEKSNGLFKKLSKEIPIKRVEELDFFDDKSQMMDLVYKFEI